MDGSMGDWWGKRPPGPEDAPDAETRGGRMTPDYLEAAFASLFSEKKAGKAGADRILSQLRTRFR